MYEIDWKSIFINLKPEPSLFYYYQLTSLQFFLAVVDRKNRFEKIRRAKTMFSILDQNPFCSTTEKIDLVEKNQQKTPLTSLQIYSPPKPQQPAKNSSQPPKKAQRNSFCIYR